MLQLVSKPKNCELKQKPCTLATKLYQPLKFHNCERMSFFTFAGLGWNCSEMVVSGWNFCFNSKPSFSFDSIGQRINFLLLLHIVATTKRIGLESKQKGQPAGTFLTYNFHLPSMFLHPTIFFTYNRSVTGFQTEKLWVKTKSKLDISFPKKSQNFLHNTPIWLPYRSRIAIWEWYGNLIRSIGQTRRNW